MKRLLRWLPFALLLVAPALSAQQRTSSPHGALSVPCTTCHRAEGWTPVRINRSFDHGKLGFPLQAAHSTASCRACHQTLDFKGTPSTCASCHMDVHRGELGADCSSCHTSRSFLDRGAMIKAHQTTRFPLEGSHLAVDCTTCHTPTGQGRQQFVSRGTECVNCHEQNFVAAKNPDHIAGGIPRDCVNCHSSTTWTRGRFNHDASGFPLTGAHRATACLQCHVGSRYTGTPNQCAMCHQANYDQTTTPKHSTAGFGTDCASCHATSSWTTAFDHSKGQFPLTGAHRAASCSQCHADGVYAGKPTTCVSCHQTDYNAAADPKHTLPSFPTTCVQCHTTTVWSPSSFRHNSTAYPLTGAHSTATCGSCHLNGVYKGTASTCVNCHQTEYNQTTNPNHAAALFGTDCTSCHTTTTWIGATFNHDASFFPIYSGRHRNTWNSCTECHTNPSNYQAFTCLQCHEHSNKTKVDNDHQGENGYQYVSAECLRCHQSP